MFKRTFTNLIEPLINNRFNQLNERIEDLKGLQITSIQNVQNQITNLDLDDLDIPSAYDIASEISTYDIASEISTYDIARNISIDSGDIAITIASDIKDGLSDIVGETVVNELKETFDILLSRLSAIETQLIGLSKPKATNKPVAKKPTVKTTATKKPVAKKVVATKKATAKK